MKSVCACVILFAVTVLHTNAREWPGRPSVFKKPAFARYMIRNAEWGVVSAYSPKYKQPFGTLQSFADGPVGGSTGVPYFYIAEWSTTWMNIMKNNTVSFTVSEAQSDYCETKGLDPMEPICGRTMLTGKIVLVEDKDELAFAKKAIFMRHPAMKHWPKSHGWKFMKLRIATVNLLSFYGGISHVSLGDYFNVKK